VLEHTVCGSLLVWVRCTSLGRESPKRCPILNGPHVGARNFAEERASEVETDCVCIAQHGVADCSGRTSEPFLSYDERVHDGGIIGHERLRGLPCGGASRDIVGIHLFQMRVILEFTGL